VQPPITTLNSPNPPQSLPTPPTPPPTPPDRTLRHRPGLRICLLLPPGAAPLQAGAVGGVVAREGVLRAGGQGGRNAVPEAERERVCFVSVYPPCM